MYLLNEPYYLTLTLAEISNAIWKHCMLYKKVSHKKAKTMFDVVIFEPFEIFNRRGITTYDAIYSSGKRVWLPFDE